MSVAICRSTTAPSFPLEKEGFGSILMMPTKRTTDSLLPPAVFPSAEDQQQQQQQSGINKDKEPPGQFDIWSSIQAQKTAANPPAAAAAPTPYVHPLGRRSSGLLSQKSLETCTESLGSETGSDDFSGSSDDIDIFSLFSSALEKKDFKEKTTVITEKTTTHDDKEEAGFRGGVAASGRKEAAAVNYHCSIGRRSPPRSFPPPLPSISRRDGPCVAMRPHRKDGRLVVEAVTVPSQNYLHAERQGGRLLLSFIDAAPKNTSEIPDMTHETKTQTQTQTQTQSEEEMVNTEPEELEEENIAMEELEELDEEEVEVVDRGTVVEVKVSTQPQQQSGAAAMKVHRSSLVINKFVSGTPLLTDLNDERGLPLRRDDRNDNNNNTAAAPVPVRRQSQTTTTAAAAAVAASSLSTVSSDEDHRPSDSKLLFSSKRRNREELLHDMRRCSQLRKPLFIWEPCCIATSS